MTGADGVPGAGRPGYRTRTWAGTWAGAAAGPLLAAGSVYGWAHWCFTGGSAPSAGVALAGGGTLIALLCAVYWTAVAGTRGFFGAVALALALLATVAAADRAAGRSEVALCVVRAVDSTVQESFGEGGPEPRTVHRHTLDCPGGYPAELKDDRRAAAVGGEVRVAYDPRRRVAPEAEGRTSPWGPVLSAALLLAVAAAIAASRRAPGARDA
ncbi:hypothetical protein [Streptomyces sp. NPDC007369]|uniref:hypothetical protein n=1 Tax=Streptomyces sp. NPDC007369 TaxID=3154589 RepID=UPI0033C9239D